MPFWLFLFALMAAMGLLVFLIDNTAVRNVIMGVAGVLTAISLIRFPVVGLGLVIGSTPIIALFPKIPFFTSFVPLIGILTFLGFLLTRGRLIKSPGRFTAVEVLGLVFIVWVFISSPTASFFGPERNWIFTLVQLWLVLWIASNLIYTEADHRTVMMIIVGTSVLSAIVALQQVGASVGITERAAGLSEGANAAARYYIYAIVLLVYLFRQFSNQTGKAALILLATAILILGVLATGSRTGIIILGIAFFLIIQRVLVGQQRSIGLLILAIFSISFVLIQVSNTNLSPSQIFESIVFGSDTVGARYRFWRIGWLMWLDHPIAGIGIDRYAVLLDNYWTYPFAPVARSLHNTYMQVLTETGFVGLSIFSLFLASAFLYFRRNAAAAYFRLSNLQWIWTTVLIVLLVGAITKTDLADKLLWFLLGITSNQYLGQQSGTSKT